MNDLMKEFMFFIPTLLCEALNKWSTLKKGYKVWIVKLSAVGASLFFSSGTFMIMSQSGLN